MQNQRLEKLLDFYKEDPNDSFTLYALATEYKKEDKQKAQEFFDILLKNHEDYVGTYYHAAALYAELNNETKAKEVYKKGMLVARKVGNTHAFAELQSAYNKFMGLDYEDEV